MIRKFIIPGLLLLLIGTAILDWVLTVKRKEQKQAVYYQSKHNSELSEHLRQYKQWLQLPPSKRDQFSLNLNQDGKTKTEAQLIQEQAERLKADMDKLAAGEISAYPFANILYGENWQQEVNKYKKQKEQREFIFTGSIVCISVGGAICSCCLLICTIRLLIRAFSRLKKFFIKIIRKRKEPKDKNPGETEAEGQENSSGKRQDSQIPLTQVLGLNDTARELKAENAKREAEIALLLSDEESAKSDKSLEAAIEAQKMSMTQLQDSLKGQVESLEKQVGEIRQMTADNSLQAAAKAQSAQGTAIAEQPELINDSLTELTQQVAAIREYASHQQDRVKKLQEGYDLNIIKNFCLRIIRCLDNLESCISKQTEQDSETMHLKEVRDELLFALESSGVEQFEPKVNSAYRGQEKYAEAVKDKQRSSKAKQTGKIAKVIRPGYQYFIDEENVKIVRPAQVRLFA